MTSASYKLNDTDHEKVYKQLESDLLASGSSSETPTAVILGAQPGAGKTLFIDLAKNTIFQGKEHVTIDDDSYRYMHPQARDILLRDDKKFAERTDPDVRIWTKRLFDAAIASKRNIIFEGTMRNKGPIMDTIKNLREKGYKVHVIALAVRAEISRGGIVERYEKQKEQSPIGCGRWTNPNTHEEAYKNMPDTLRAIEKESPIESITVYNRAQEELYSNERETDGNFHKPPQTKDAASTVIRERTRPLTKEEKTNILRMKQNIEQKMNKRGAQKQDISEAKLFMSGIIKNKENEHGHNR